ncbi:MAG TPA: cell division protein ZapE [Hyphomicrobiaceae bacterium]|nr:cell division protein ZapE [Hyphomicrobiaceae bacterium]
MSSGVAAELRRRVAAGEADQDAAQLAVASRLDDMAAALRGWDGTSRGRLGGLFRRSKPLEAPRGLYIHGQVGRGKTMLMDLFHGVAPVKRKWRIHFHEFMADVHDRIAEARKTVDGDPIAPVARAIADKAALLCFDEFHVTDIADAMILGRLFTALFDAGVVVVATSNVPPSGLYKNGLNRQLFEPFIRLLESKVDIVELASAKDFRLEKLIGHPLYFSPLGPASDRALRDAFHRISGVEHGHAEALEVKGRIVPVPEAANGVAVFTFDELCNRPLGAVDYLHIAHQYHTLILRDVPRLDRDRRAEARRFIALIDTLYDARVGLVVSADAEPDEIYPKGDEAFLFERTASRLMEMRSPAYLEARANRVGEAATAAV